MKQTNKYYTLTEYENTGDILTKVPDKISDLLIGSNK